jgi:hypothetical protein
MHRTAVSEEAGLLRQPRGLLLFDFNDVFNSIDKKGSEDV